MNFRALIEEISDVDKVREFQDKINKLKKEKTTAKDPELVQIKIDTVEKELSIFIEL